MDNLLLNRLLQARIQAGVTDPEMLAFCHAEAAALTAELSRQCEMSPEERQQHLARTLNNG